jgi:hypothetical protein
MSQTQNEAAASAPQPLPVPTLAPMAGVLSYLVPGLGQIVQGRIGKGVFFMVVLLGMFHAGQAMGGWKNVYMPIVEHEGDRVRRSYNPLQSIYYRWHYAGQFFIGVSAWPAILQFYETPLPFSDPEWRNFQREPLTREKERNMAARNPGRPAEFSNSSPSPEGKLNQEIAASTKAWDLGWVYTVVAGVLNILVIYDAVAGPAFGARRIKETKDKPQAEAAPS